MGARKEPVPIDTTGMDEEQRSVAEYTQAREWASKHGLKDLWNETDKIIRLHVAARGWQELQQETTARQLMPLLIPLGSRRQEWTKGKASRIVRAIARLSKELDAQLDGLARLTWALYDAAPRFPRKGGTTKPRKPSLTVSAAKLGLESGWGNGGVGSTAERRRLSIRAKHYESAVGLVKSVAGSLTLVERCVVDNLHQRGWRLVPPCHVMESLIEWSDDVDGDVDSQNDQNDQNVYNGQFNIVTTTSENGCDSVQETGENGV